MTTDLSKQSTLLSCKQPPDRQTYGHQRDNRQNRFHQEFCGLESQIKQNKRTDADADCNGFGHRESCEEKSVHIGYAVRECRHSIANKICDKTYSSNSRFADNKLSTAEACKNHKPPYGCW